MEIRSLSAVAATPRIGRASDAERAQAGRTQAPPDPASSTIAGAGDGAVRQDAPAAPSEARYVRDNETHRLVLSVVDPGTGDVIAQLPTKAALRAQAYAAEVAARSAPRPTIARLA